MAATPLGPHVALPLFCAAYAWEERSVFWRYTTPILTAYAIGVPAWIGGGVELLPHALAGLVAWGLGRLLPGGGGSGAEPDAGGRRGFELDAGLARLTRSRRRGIMRACPAGARRFAPTVAASWVRSALCHSCGAA